MSATIKRVFKEEGARVPASPEVHIIRRLAVGGMSELFLAELRCPDGSVTPVVVKRLLEGNKAAGSTYFRRELEALSSISSPHVVRLIQGNEDQLVLEHIDGPNLETILTSLGREGRTLPFAAAMALFEGILLGLKAIHEATPPLVHRDLSPSNVLVSRAGEVKLADLGLVRRELADEPTLPGLKGTLAYMAPEQLMGKTVDARTDLYAAGLIAYEVLTGVPARPEGPCGLHELLQARSILPAPPSSVRPGLPGAVDIAVLKALEPNPSRRPPTAQAFLDDLRFALQVQPDQQALARYASAAAQAPLHLERTLAPQAPRPRPARRGIAWALGVAVTMLAIIVAAWVATRVTGPIHLFPVTSESIVEDANVIPGDLTSTAQVKGLFQVDGLLPEVEDPGPLTPETTRDAPKKPRQMQKQPGPSTKLLLLKSPQALHVTSPSVKGLAPISVPLGTEPQLILLHAGPGALPVKLRVMPGPDSVSFRLGAPEGQYYQVSCGGKALGPTPTAPTVLSGPLTCQLATAQGETASFELSIVENSH